MTANDLTDEERRAVISALKEKLDRDRYPRSPRLEPFRSALAKLDPSTSPQPIGPKPPLPGAPARARGGRRVRR